MNLAFEIHFTLDYEEYRRCNRHVLFGHLRKRLLSRLLLMLVLIPLALILLFMLAKPASNPHPEEPRPEMPVWPLFVGYFIILVVIVFIIALSFYAIRRRWRTGTELREPRTYRFFGDGFEVEGTTFRARTDWENIQSAETAGGLILLSTAQKLFHIIPTRAFAGPEELEDFKEFLRPRVADSRRLR